MSEFPKMLYRAPGPHDCGGVMCEYVTVSNADQEADRLSSGWYLTAVQAGAGPVATTRADLIAEATVLGLKIDKRWSDDRIAGELAAVKR